VTAVFTEATSKAGCGSSGQSSTPPLCAWLFVQTLAIALPAFRIPLWIHSPEATESIALPVLFSVQILAAAMLSPRLCRRPVDAAIAIVTAWPFLFAAGILGAVSLGQIFWAGAYVAAWLGALGILQSCLSEKGRMMAAGCVAAWAAAGPILTIFMRNERPDGSLPVFSEAARAVLGPLTSGLPLIDPASHHSAMNWVGIAVILILGSGAKWGKYGMMRHRAGHSRTAS
jgi:hypothetical protein